MRMTPNIDIWFIGRNEDNSIIHYAFEEYTNEADWLIRLAELGITPE